MNEPGAGSYLDAARLPFPFCQGCSHGRILHQLDDALGRLALDPRQVVLVTDIGCVGLSDQYFTTNSFHGLHGRSITYATGIKLANPALQVVVLMGDGGAGIGANHLIHAARRNIGLTVLVFNNFNFGMTGGQHSVTTPPGGRTPTTPLGGQLEQPLDLCATAAANGAGFVARALFSDPQLPDLLDRALCTQGFALLDIWELCVRFARANPKELLPGERLKLGQTPSGVVAEKPRPEYAQEYRRLAALGPQGQPPQRALVPILSHPLPGPLRCVLAGSAGGRVRSAANLLSLGGVLAGLWATQRDEYPVTVASGYSLAQVILSPKEIQYTGIAQPDWMLVVSPEGLRKSRGLAKRMDRRSRLYLRADLWPVESDAQVTLLDFAAAPLRLREEEQALAGLAAALQHSALYPLDALRAAVARDAAHAQGNLRVLEASLLLPLHEVAPHRP
ncbi:MAG: 2-oxoglutarate synthase [Chloroflexi bacterium]|nr:2-oxoglutarate synthase [Chloroflexota bacterium]